MRGGGGVIEEMVSHVESAGGWRRARGHDTGGGWWQGVEGGREGAGLRDEGPLEVEYGGCGALRAMAGRRREEVKRRLDTTKMFLMSEAEERGGRGAAR